MNSSAQSAPLEATNTAGHTRYVLVTPARNEAAFIRQTIESVVRQTVRPRRWVIVSDGSTDGTDEIVASYASTLDWLRLVRVEPGAERSFAGKVHAFNAGKAALSDLEYDFIGSLDADITFDETYFAFLLDRFAEDPDLGVAGTPFREGTRQYDYRFTNIEHVSGACQVFRRRCFEDVGGYQPVKGGGVDWIAVTTARMKGWHTRTFCQKVCHHLRPLGTATASRLTARFRLGRKDYSLGGHPIWEVARSLYQMPARPVLVGGVFLLAGYFWAWLSNAPRAAGPELVRFHQQEQLCRLRALVRRTRARLVPARAFGRAFDADR